MQADQRAQQQRLLDMERQAKEKFALEESAHLRKLEDQMNAEEQRMADLQAEILVRHVIPAVSFCPIPLLFDARRNAQAAKEAGLQEVQKAEAMAKSARDAEALVEQRVAAALAAEEEAKQRAEAASSQLAASQAEARQATEAEQAAHDRSLRQVLPWL